MQSLRQFSRLAGVSVSTASRVFSGTGRVHPETKRRVLELAELTGFRPTTVGRVAFGGRTRSVGVLTGPLMLDYFARMTSGMQECFLEVGYLPVVLEGEQSDTFGKRALRRLVDHRVDGIIRVFGDEATMREEWVEIARAKLPLVCIGPQMNGWDCDWLDTDDRGGSREATEHLLGLGHRRIGYTYYGDGLSSCGERVEGMREALLAGGLFPDKRYRTGYAPGDRTRETSFRQEVRRVLTLPDRPTAMLATTDIHALIVYEEARELGLDIPDDLSVVGFGDLQFARMLTPPLTTVRQDGFALGRRAAGMMLERLSDTLGTWRSEFLPVELVVRQSTGRAREEGA